MRVSAAVERSTRTFLADLREGWDVFRSLTWLWRPIADTIGLSTALWTASAGIVATTLALVSVPAVRQVRR
jgi:hypothetical protein